MARIHWLVSVAVTSVSSLATAQPDGAASAASAGTSSIFAKAWDKKCVNSYLSAEEALPFTSWAEKHCDKDATPVMIYRGPGTAPLGNSGTPRVTPACGKAAYCGSGVGKGLYLEEP